MLLDSRDGPALMRTELTTALLAATLLVGCGVRPPIGLAGAGGNTGVCQHTCTTDPGSQPVSCAAAETGIEFMDPPLWDFDTTGQATYMYSYTDKTARIASFGMLDTSQNPPKEIQKTWQPATIDEKRCADTPGVSTGVIHIQGGPFLGWGGGVGISMRDFNTPNCPNPAHAFCEPATVPLANKMIDVSAWEGVSFWARRGPDSQAGFRVTVGDKYTDDDISFESYNINHGYDAGLVTIPNPPLPIYCQRVKECACLNHMDCRAGVNPTDFVPGQGCKDSSGVNQISCNRPLSPTNPMLADRQLTINKTPTLFCGQPAVDTAGDYSGVSGWAQWNTCMQERCDDPYPAFQGTRDVDVQFNGKPCTPHVLSNGISTSFCYDPATDPPPANSDQQCGDHWNKTTELTSDWRLYTVPFSSMGQQGFGKRAARLDLTAVSLVRFTWDGGWIDYYVDNVRFYRRTK